MNSAPWPTITQPPCAPSERTTERRLRKYRLSLRWHDELKNSKHSNSQLCRRSSICSTAATGKCVSWAIRAGTSRSYTGQPSRCVIARATSKAGVPASRERATVR